MGTPKPLGKKTLGEKELKQDRKKAKRYDQCGLGAKAIYMGSTMSPRSRYVLYSEVSHVYKRVAESTASGKGFLAPILYIVVRFDDGQEYQTSFRYLQDADKMMDELEANHPEISLLSPEGEVKKAKKEAEEDAIQNRELSDSAEHEKNMLMAARRFLEKRPSLYKHLASVAKMKRRRDLVNPAYEAIAWIVLLLGFALLAGGIAMAVHGGFSGTMIILILLFGAMLVFLMFNSKVLPNRRTTRKALQKEYESAVQDMKRSLKAEEGFPIPPAYCHPYVIDRMVRIIQEGRADNAEDALNVLKEDLKKMDSSVALSGDDYTQVVTIKPMFLVNDYR